MVRVCLQFVQHREAANTWPPLKQRQNLSNRSSAIEQTSWSIKQVMHSEFDYINQSCSAKGKIAPAMLLPHEESRHCLLLFCSQMTLGKLYCRMDKVAKKRKREEKAKKKIKAEITLSIEKNPFPAKKQTVRSYRIYILPKEKASSALIQLESVISYQFRVCMKEQAPAAIAPSKKISHWANLCFSVHTTVQTCALKTSEAFQAVSDKKFKIASQREWDLTAQIIWQCCVIVQLYTSEGTLPAAK